MSEAVVWKSVIDDLVTRGGFTRVEIARLCGNAAPSTITDIENGRTLEPRYGLGRQLIDLHRKHIKSRKAA